MTTISTTEPAPTLEDVWRLFRENALQMQETERRFQETDRKFQENALQMKEHFQETERLMRESSQETDRKFQETERLLNAGFQKTSTQMRETSQKVKELDQLFNTQWGRLMESLVEGALIGIFNDWGLPVADTTTRVRGSYQGNPFEFDIIAHNGDTVVVVEVKTTLRTKDVTRFLHKLGQVKTWMQRYANNRIYGAMAFLQANAGAELMVVNKGMFAIRATGDSAHIINPQGFEPRAW